MKILHQSKAQYSCYDESRKKSVTTSISESFRESTFDINYNDEAFDYEDILDNIGFGKVQWCIMLVCGLFLMFTLNETMGMSIITIASQCDFRTNSMQKAFMGAACFVGIILSSYLWGYLSDRIGRRKVLLISSTGSIITSCITLFAPNYWTYVMLRMVVGLLLGAVSSTTYVYLGEFCNVGHRAMMINYGSIFVALSNIYVPASAWLILSMTWTFNITSNFILRPWRLLTIANFLPGLVACVALLWLPESPKVLLAMNRHQDAIAIVNWISVTNTCRSLTDIKLCKLKQEQSGQIESVTKTLFEFFKNIWPDMMPLFKRPHILKFLSSCSIMCGLFLGSSGMALWYPEIQIRIGTVSNEQSLSICSLIHRSTNKEESDTICSDEVSKKILTESMLFGVCFTVCFLCFGFFINFFGRKATMVSTLLLAMIFILALQWIVNPLGISICFCLFLVLPGLCISVLSGAVVDLLPTYLRGKAVCICLMFGRAGSVIGSNIIGVFLDNNCTLTFFLFSGSMLLCAALSLTLPL